MLGLRSKALRLPGFGPAVTVLVILLLVTAAAWRLTRTAVEARAQAQFTFTAAELAADVADRLDAYEQALWGAASMLAATPSLSEEQWRGYVERLRMPERMPGTRGVGFASYVRPAELEAHLRDMRQGDPGYAIAPPGERGEYAPNVFLASPGNRRALGFDLLTDPLRRIAADRARETGRAALTRNLVLIQEAATEMPNGFLLYLPVFRAGLPVETPAERQAALQGFVYSPFATDELIAGSLRGRDGDIAMTIFDGSDPRASARIYRSRSAATDENAYQHQVTLSIVDRTWTFRFTALPSYVSGVDRNVPLLALAAGMLISLLAAATVGALAANRSQAEAANARLRADVARREQVEEQLRENETKFRLLFDDNPQPMWAFDRVTLRFVEVNNTAVTRYGYTREEFLAMRVTDIRPAEDVPHFVANLAGSPVGYRRMGRYRHKLKDGRIIDVEIDAHEIQLAGRPLTLVLAQDITERARAEAALQRSQARFQAIMDNAPLMVSLKGLDGRYVFANRRFCQHYSVAPDRIAGRTAAEVLPEARVAEENAADVQVRQRRRPVQYEHTEPSAERPRVTLSVHFPVPGASGEVEAIGAITADITEIKWVEDQLRQAQKMEAVGHLTGGVAHDFNNLLTVIIGNAELLHDQVAPQPALAGLVDTIQSAADRGAELTRRLLAFSRRQALRPSEVDLNKLVRGMDGLLRRTLGEDIEIRAALSTDLWAATVDASQVESALLNLAVNARDAMPNGGKLLIETGNLTLDDEASATYRFGVPVGDYVMLAVTDTGTGIPPEVLEHVFEPFFTTKEVGKGSGLGLSMVYGFVKQSGGFVKIYSELNQGTAVRLYLPRAVAGGAAESTAESETELPGGRECILVVEDDELVRNYVVARLASLGYAVRQATDARSALADLETGGTVDLLFTDVILPHGLNGRELVDRALLRFPTLKVLYTSGYTEDAIVHQGRLDPGVALLHKPYRKEALARKVREVLDGG